MALLTLTSTLVGWYNLRFISQVEKDNTQALIPTMNMARQLSEASAWELFAAQNLTSADNEKMWQAQGRMLTAQSLKINALLQALREQGFDTTAIEQQGQSVSDNVSPPILVLTPKNADREHIRRSLSPGGFRPVYFYQHTSAAKK